MEQMNPEGLDTLTIDSGRRLAKKRPHVSAAADRDGNAFCCLLEPDRQDGVFGCGNTALEAVLD